MEAPARPTCPPPAARWIPGESGPPIAHYCGCATGPGANILDRARGLRVVGDTSALPFGIPQVPYLIPGPDAPESTCPICREEIQIARQRIVESTTPEGVRQVEGMRRMAIPFTLQEPETERTYRAWYLEGRDISTRVIIEGLAPHSAPGRATGAILGEFGIPYVLGGALAQRFARDAGETEAELAAHPPGAQLIALTVRRFALALESGNATALATSAHPNLAMSGQVCTGRAWRQHDAPLDPYQRSGTMDNLSRGASFENPLSEYALAYSAPVERIAWAWRPESGGALAPASEWPFVEPSGMRSFSTWISFFHCGAAGEIVTRRPIQPAEGGTLWDGGTSQGWHGDGDASASFRAGCAHCPYPCPVKTEILGFPDSLKFRATGRVRQDVYLSPGALERYEMAGAAVEPAHLERHRLLESIRVQNAGPLRARKYRPTGAGRAGAGPLFPAMLEWLAGPAHGTPAGAGIGFSLRRPTALQQLRHVRADGYPNRVDIVALLGPLGLADPFLAMLRADNLAHPSAAELVQQEIPTSPAPRPERRMPSLENIARRFRTVNRCACDMCLEGELRRLSIYRADDPPRFPLESYFPAPEPEAVHPATVPEPF